MNILFLYHDIPFELYTVYIIICITLINMKHSHFFLLLSSYKLCIK